MNDKKIVAGIYVRVSTIDQAHEGAFIRWTKRKVNWLL